MAENSSFSKGLKNPAQMDDSEDFLTYFGRLKLGSDGNLEAQEAPQSNDTAPSSVSMANDIKKIKNQSLAPQENPWLLNPPVSSSRSIWGYNFFHTDGESSASKAAAKDGAVDYFKHEDCGSGSSNQRPTMESLCNIPSKSDCLNQFKANRFITPPIYNCENGGFMQNNGLYYGNYYGALNNDLSCNSKWVQQEMDAFHNPKPQFHLDFLQEIRAERDYEWAKTMIQCSRGHYLSLMTDHRMSNAFQKLVDVCSDQQLQVIVEEILSSRGMFVDAAFCYHGASSMSRLIKKIKRSSYALSVTKLLSKRFVEIMTHDTARRVIQDCFIYFGHLPNKILYEEAISHFLDLAVNKVGCRALNELVNTISSEQGSRLLNHIADHSAYLSKDQYGNYVVQTVLSLNIKDVNWRIMVRLRDEFVELARTKGGSHVVEKCIESSDIGIVTVVEKILEDPKVPLCLALDEFGNYVIQKALKMTKERGLRDLYRCLVIHLLPYYEELHLTAGGKKVLHLMRDGGWMRW